MWNKIRANWLPFILLVLAFLVIAGWFFQRKSYSDLYTESDSSWHAPSYFTEPIKDETTRELVLYGEELIAHTSRYLGPSGTVQQISNGMNCQNCHLDAGKKQNGNNYAAVAATYPKFRARSGHLEVFINA